MKGERQPDRRRKTVAEVKRELAELEEELASSDATMKAMLNLSEQRERLRHQITELRVWLGINK